MCVAKLCLLTFLSISKLWLRRYSWGFSDISKVPVSKHRSLKKRVLFFSVFVTSHQLNWFWKATPLCCWCFVRLLNRKDKRSKCSVLKVAKFHPDVKIFHNSVDVKGAAIKREAPDEFMWKKSACFCCGGKFNTVLGCFSRGRRREEIKLYFKSFLWQQTLKAPEMLFYHSPSNRLNP